MRKMALIRGFSLIELLISMVIAAIIFTGVVKVAFNAKRSSYDGEQLSFVQDNARFVLSQIKREVRLSGYTGCASIESASKSVAIVDDLGGFIKLTEGVQGYESGEQTFPATYASDALPDTDSFIVRFGDAAEELTVKSHNVTGARFNLWADYDLPVGTTMLSTDASCRELGLFQITGTATKILEHAADGSRNCTRVIKSSVKSIACGTGCGVSSCGGASENALKAGSKLMPYRVHAYYVGESNLVAGMPALKRQTLTSTGGAAATETEEIAIGVEDLQVVYGVDLDDDDEANQYLASHQVSDWSKVVALRLTLVFRSDREVYSSDQNVTIKLDGSDYQLSTDKYLRQVVTTSIKIRNS